MASDDDGPPRAPRGDIHDGAEGGVHVTDDTQAARWKTLALDLPEAEVRKRIEHALASLGPRDTVVGGSASVRGYVITFRNRRHVRAAEVELAGWDGGTQVHVALPAEYKPTDLAAIVNWLRPVLGIGDAAEQ